MTNLFTADHTMPSKGRRAKLQAALAELERNGVTGAMAYPPASVALAKIGLITKPAHYWAFLPLVIFMMTVLTVIFGGAIFASLAIGVVPRPIATMIDLGPIVFFGLVFLLSMGAAFYYRSQAKAMNLTPWHML